MRRHPLTINVADTVKLKFLVENVGEINPTLIQQVYDKVYEQLLANLKLADVDIHKGDLTYYEMITSDLHYRVQAVWVERDSPNLLITRPYWGGSRYFRAVQVQPHNFYEVANLCEGEVLYYEDRDPGPGWILMNPKEPYRSMIAGLGDYIVESKKGSYFMMPANQFREVFKRK